VKVSYDPETDTLTVILKENTPISESDEDKPGVILDYDAEGNLVSMEILDAARRKHAETGQKIGQKTWFCARF